MFFKTRKMLVEKTMFFFLCFYCFLNVFGSLVFSRFFVFKTVFSGWLVSGRVFFFYRWWGADTARVFWGAGGVSASIVHWNAFSVCGLSVGNVVWAMAGFMIPHGAGGRGERVQVSSHISTRCYCYPAHFLHGVAFYFIVCIRHVFRCHCLS